MVLRTWARIVVIWLILSTILELLIALVPIPAPTGSSQASIEHRTIYVLFAIAVPIFVFVCVVLLQSLVMSRRRLTVADEEPSAAPESTVAVALWLGLSVVVVLFLSSWGIFTLNQLTQPPTASTVIGTEQASIAGKAVHPLDVQVIGQEWYWTFRYPSYSGMESADLYLPVNTPIHFHVTSLDVVHSFWIYDYGVKEDAVPGVDNDVWMLARTTSSYTPDGTNWVKCNELCGAGHSVMRTRLYVVSRAKFNSWAMKQRAAEASSGLFRELPSYRAIYYLAPHSRWPPPPQAGSSNPASSSPVDTTHVAMAGSRASQCLAHLDCFYPAVIRVHLGQVVTWTNKDQDLHDAVANNSSFDTGILPSSATAVWVPRRPGVYTYFCTLHLYMQGKVIVEK